MKIFILAVQPEFLPERGLFRYPSHNRDYGVEQDFLKFLTTRPEITVQLPDEADWHYLPVYWTRWHLNHDYGRQGLSDLQQKVPRLIQDDARTFTICQYDDGPLIDLGKTTIFLASRKTASGIDIPLLSSPHRKPLFCKPKKEYIASFVGRLSTYPVRQEMAECLKNRPDVFIYDGDRGTSFFVRKMLKSYVALCPRGYGGSSFRFFEAMQLGVVPFLISDIDTRPFKKFINWDELSLFADSVSGLSSVLDTLQTIDLIAMGKRAAVTWEKLTYQKWCDYVIEELRILK